MTPVWMTLTVVWAIGFFVLRAYGAAHWAWWPLAFLGIVCLGLSVMSLRHHTVSGQPR